MSVTMNEKQFLTTIKFGFIIPPCTCRWQSNSKVATNLVNENYVATTRTKKVLKEIVLAGPVA